MKRIQKHYDILKVLSTCKKCIRNNIISKADSELINTICECVYNLLKGNIKLSEVQFKNLKPFRHILRKLLAKSNTKEKKKILIQKGGFLEILLPAVISGLASIISSAISSSE